MESSQVAPSLGGELAYHLIAGFDAPDGEQVRIPAVAHHSRSPHGRVAAPGDPDRRIRFLRREGQQRNVIEVEEFTVVGNVFFGP